MSYRDEGAALDAKRASLAARLDEARRGPQTDDAVDEAHALKREIAGLPLPKKVGAPPLALLPRLRIASPCEENWNEMVGDERTRRCTRCERDVYNLSGFTRGEAEALLSQSGEAPCVRFYRRTDGTIMTGDCVQGSHRKLVLKVLAASACAVAAATAMVANQPDEAPLRFPLRAGEPVVSISGFDAPFEGQLFEPCTAVEGESFYERLLREDECEMQRAQNRWAMGGPMYFSSDEAVGVLLGGQLPLDEEELVHALPRH